jgi:hypothetical protein
MLNLYTVGRDGPSWMGKQPGADRILLGLAAYYGGGAKR